ncbi:hypothetical protein [Nocardia donostiensis]|uniref:CBM-cenC domain-containing protein n=1 Tax=Nocardia donostiensis TaxID=1538463 RepID=A0A1W0BA71_9NOCA|nr:hypothetical protein [Nocardia donostiensis]ONM50032.1 hypothetical protein B0T46_02700 [Nocardia donostiensis]OQS15691.1 hypothetical protein B0T36_06780 [Nocardia donostiensis]OQS19397.1 hypothetical protein B0T44_14435 [Nocardia donostiensis]
MANASVEVLLDDFENKDRWEVAGNGAGRTHLTTFAEGAPSKRPGVYADGVAGADYRALVLLIRSAADELEIELVAKAGNTFAISGRVAAVRLWVRSPHASIRVSAHVRETVGGERELTLGSISAHSEWKQLECRLSEPVNDVALLALTVRLTEVCKREGEVMILLDDLTALTTS